MLPDSSAARSRERDQSMAGLRRVFPVTSSNVPGYYVLSWAPGRLIAKLDHLRGTSGRANELLPVRSPRMSSVDRAIDIVLSRK